MPRKKDPIKIGIDFGNMITMLIAILSAGVTTFFKDINGATAIASVLYMAAKDKIYYGFAAENAEKTDPSKMLRSIKMGMEECNPDGSAPPIFMFGDLAVTAQQAAVIILKALKIEFEKQLNRIIDSCVISVPANYSDIAKKRTREAALEAGFEKVKLVSESSAAATAFGLEKEAQGVILVVDVGGGTTDVTLMRIEGGRFTELATAGEKRLGGGDIDNVIFDRVEEEFKLKTGRSVDIRTDPRLMAHTRDQVITAKHALSVLPEVQICVSIENEQIAFTLIRSELERMIAPLLDKLGNVVREPIAKAGLSMAQIDHLVLVGGTSKVPAVRKRVESITGKSARQDIDPETAVAMGDALLAQVVNYDEDAPQFLDDKPTDDEVALSLIGRIQQLTLICPHALGVEVILPDNHPRAGQLGLADVYPENSPLGQTISRMFKPERPFQTHVNVKIMEGKPQAPTEQCRILGEFELPIAVRDKTEASICVSFSYSQDGLVKVTARDTVSGSTGEHELKIS